MADFIFNVDNGASFNVTQTSLIETECASQCIYDVNSDDSDSITIELTGPILSAKYSLGGTETNWDGTSVVLLFDTDLTIEFVIDNSGTPGVFNTISLSVNNTTQVQEYTDEVTRQNDSLSCDNPNGDGGTYDDLTDTPDTKVGEALKLVRVNAAEDGHEYVDPGNLGNDLNYTHVFTSTTSVVILHGLGKIPSVTIIDGSSNTIYGDITYTDLNNLTITFKQAFAGTAYLN
jgi:hypothetical protein